MILKFVSQAMIMKYIVRPFKYTPPRIYFASATLQGPLVLVSGWKLAGWFFQISIWPALVFTVEDLLFPQLISSLQSMDVNLVADYFFPCFF